jgi:predicted dehydrogenase
MPADPVRNDPAVAGGGVLTHWTIHNLDLALWLLGEPEPLTASASRYRRRNGGSGGAQAGAQAGGGALVEDFATGFVRLAGGTTLTVEANWLQPPSARPEGWEILGDRRALSISPLRVYADGPGGWQDETPPPGRLAPCDYDMSRLMAGFLDRVRAGGPAPVSGAAIVRIQRLLDALYLSAATGREIDLRVDGSR